MSTAAALNPRPTVIRALITPAADKGHVLVTLTTREGGERRVMLRGSRKSSQRALVTKALAAAECVAGWDMSYRWDYSR